MEAKQKIKALEKELIELKKSMKHSWDALAFGYSQMEKAILKKINSLN